MTDQRVAAERVARELWSSNVWNGPDPYDLDAIREHWIKVITDALLTREREARRLALEEAAKIAEGICQHPRTERCSHGTAPYLIAKEICARAKEAGDE